MEIENEIKINEKIVYNKPDKTVKKYLRFKMKRKMQRKILRCIFDFCLL